MYKCIYVTETTWMNNVFFFGGESLFILANSEQRTRQIYRFQNILYIYYVTVVVELEVAI